MKSGRRILWKVHKKFDDDLLLINKGAKIFLKYSDWIGPNVLKAPKQFLRDEARYAFFKVK